VINQQQLVALKKKDPYTAEIISQLIVSINKLNNYHGIDTSGNVTAPKTVGQLVVTAANGVFRVTIIDKSAISRGINYFLEHDTNALFPAPVTLALGPSRDWQGFLGSGNFFFRCYSQYPLSPPSPIIYFGTQAVPTPVAGGGAIAGPAPLPEQGSGTNPTLPGHGFGNTPSQPGSFTGFRGAQGPNQF
jgi:hypothetical protein